MTANVSPRRLLPLLLSSLLFAAAAAFANDSSIGDANGSIELIRQPDIRMSKEDLFISEERVQVDYVFTNTSTRELLVPIAFPMPPMYFGMADHSALTDFRLWVDGKPVRTERKLVAKLDGSDISRAWAASGWTPDDLAEYVEGGTVPAGRTPLPARWFDADGQPRFTLSEYFVWQQRFPAGGTVAIRHSYVPSVATGVPMPASDLIGEYAKSTCLDAATQQRLRRRAGANGLQWSNLRYVLRTGANWKGPIQDFHLTLKKRAPGDLLSLCFDGELQRIDALTFEFRQRDFVPERDLDILFLR
ncbi:DUF4424 domain-containing protein [Xanthomonas sacchari]|uniref:DUF4424 domain-containing protein n=1 Tax=Xanthomonas sacchari TaxID=56458 RepID=UPI00225E48F5|nr:DUF4424 domain-containing protein [Xanthomonas sacchari]UYK80925.1 DUF4424 domain-containing protein [Xanthomonas sacchari]